MIEDADLENILATAKGISTVVEIYDSDTVPTNDGFDPADALDCFAGVSGANFLGIEYKRLLKSINNPSRSITPEINTSGATFSNLDNYISNFEFAHGFEGLIMVVRAFSRSQSDTLSKSQILFVGRCEKPKSGKRESLSVSAKSVLESLDIKMPRRKFAPVDYKGRAASDPEFEGFISMPQTGFVNYSVREKRGGILGLFGFKKTVQKTLAYSSFSDLDANKPLPEVFGTSQILGTHIGYVDSGTNLNFTTAFCEGEIEAFINPRSVVPHFPLAHFASTRGLVGALNDHDPAWIAPGYYSRTAYARGWFTNSAVSETDEAPDIAVVIKGRKLKVPSDGWDAPVWTNNAASVWRYLITGGDYYSLDENWVDDDAAEECWNFNDEKIFNVNSSDFLFLD